MSRVSQILLLTLLIITTHLGESRSLSNNSSSSLISDGMQHVISLQSDHPIIELEFKATTVTCEPIYGFLPCTTEVWGQLFMIVVYEVLLSMAGTYVSNGSNLFFQMFETGVFGASVFQILGTIPQVVLILVTGVTASTDTVETLVTMGMGLLTGSTVMLLTLIWGSVVAFGSYDLSQPSAADSSDVEENKTPFSLTGYGVSIDIETYYTSRIMIVSMIPFLILQMAKVLNSSSGTRIVVLVALLVTLSFLFVYFTYQVFQPWIQSRRLEYSLRKHVQKNLLPSLLTAGGRPSLTLIRELFQKIDKNNDKYISPKELRALILGLQIKGGLKEVDLEGKVMEEFDISGDSNIIETEFVKGISNWLSASQQSASNQDHDRPKFSGSTSKKTSEEQVSLVAQKKESTKGTDKGWLNYVKAAFLIVLGTAIMILLAQPLLETLQEFSSAVNISSFGVSYVVIPLAMNYRQALNAITSAREKTGKAISLTFSEIYNGVFMNNMMGLATFLALVYIRDLSWDVSAEVLVVLLVCTGMSLFTSFCPKFPFWTGIIAYLLYPLSLLLIYILTTLLGWS
ncbi:sodium/calcium exchanger NCL2-like [Alnus glutinosa]|uniref:sodium/calcium exchanger NCL2-like n=1 Tax=Alnus glutinosa TaxID=3517 RepID=UPI002D77EEE6|nr:sodium/calcium exchanger NCL2-like [Alnus glutinosa]